MNEIYLDHNATTCMCAEAMGAIHNSAWFGNASSQHAKGRQTARKLEQETQIIRDILQVPDSAEILFTSGATEANNIALLGFRTEVAYERHMLVTSAIEHPSILAPLDEKSLRGHDTRTIGVNAAGKIKLHDLKHILDSETNVGMVAVMLANHETGVIQPVEQAARMCADYGCPIHVDATQAVGKMDVSFAATGASSMSLSAHKFGGPVGIGCLIVQDHLLPHLRPLMYGGHQQQGLRPGTLPVALVAGMAAALKHCDDYAGGIRGLNKQNIQLLETRLIASGIPMAFNGLAPRVGNTTNISFHGVSATKLVDTLSSLRIFCSAGAACSGQNEPSPTLKAMGANVSEAVRFSVGVTNTKAEIEEAAKTIIAVCRHDSLA